SRLPYPAVHRPGRPLPRALSGGRFRSHRPRRRSRRSPLRPPPPGRDPHHGHRPPPAAPQPGDRDRAPPGPSARTRRLIQTPHHPRRAVQPSASPLLPPRFPPHRGTRRLPPHGVAPVGPPTRTPPHTASPPGPARSAPETDRTPRSLRAPPDRSAAVTPDQA